MRLFFRGNMETGVPANFSLLTSDFGGICASAGRGFATAGFFFSTLGLASTSGSFFALRYTKGVLGRGFERYAMASASYVVDKSSTAFFMAFNMSSTFAGSITPEALPPKSPHVRH